MTTRRTLPEALDAAQTGEEWMNVLFGAFDAAAAAARDEDEQVSE